MSKELIVSSGRHETRVAILEDDQIVELFHEREKEYSLAGSIHKGRVTRVLPGMQSAFVDIGLERDAFLYVSDFFEDNEEYDAVVSTVEEKVLKMEKGERGADSPAVVADYVINGAAEELNSPALTAVVTVPPPDAKPDPARENRGGAQGRQGDRAAGGQDNSGRSGRRGRRRRGGRGGSGLPESKFYSPRDDAREQSTRETRDGAGEAEVTESPDLPGERRQHSGSASLVSSTPAPATGAGTGEDFMVLPGESLAKYSAPESRGQETEEEEPSDWSETDRAGQPSAQAGDAEPLGTWFEEPAGEAPSGVYGGSTPVASPRDTTAAWETPHASHSFTPVPGEPVAERKPEASVSAPEPALPFEHPLAGLGAISSWVSEPGTEPVGEPAAAHLSKSTQHSKSETAPTAQELASSHTAVQEPETEGDPDRDESALELEGEAIETSAEIEDSVETDEGLGSFSSEVLDREPIMGMEDAGTVGSETLETATGDGGSESEEEGPEPARIPTSLTATLREQGHRYPHRVSRRMRRKMRGQAGEQGGEAQGKAASGEQKPGGGQARQGGAELAPFETRTADVRTEGRPERSPDRGPERSPERSPDRGDERTERQGRGDRRPDQRGGDRGGDRARADRPERERTAFPSISDLLKEGQEIIVQIAKEPLGQKGARITSHIALPGRFVVYMPTVDHVGVSRKIPSDEERQRLKKILQTHRQGIPGGFICRTAGDGKSEEELKNDMHFLYNMWLDMRQKAEKKPAPVLLHHDLDLVERVLRDQLTSSFKTIWVDNEEYYESILRFVQRFQPALVSRVKLYTRSTPIFDEFGVTNEVEKALRPKVWLKSGGYIVINQTEALVAIDINTGKYVGKSNRLEDTIVKINTDAIKEIVRQIRLRDLGGIIVVDFIDMDERKNRQKVMQALEEAMRADRAPYKILQFNDFGLVAITRKRVKQSLERTLCSPCPYCEGAGYVKSVTTVIGEILQEAQRIQKAIDTNDVTLRVNPDVAKLLKSNQNSYLQEIEEIVGRTVLVKSDPLLHQTKFDLA